MPSLTRWGCVCARACVCLSVCPFVSSGGVRAAGHPCSAPSSFQGLRASGRRDLNYLWPWHWCGGQPQVLGGTPGPGPLVTLSFIVSTLHSFLFHILFCKKFRNIFAWIIVNRRVFIPNVCNVVCLMIRTLNCFKST